MLLFFILKRYNRKTNCKVRKIKIFETLRFKPYKVKFSIRIKILPKGMFIKNLKNRLISGLTNIFRACKADECPSIKKKDSTIKQGFQRKDECPSKEKI